MGDPGNGCQFMGSPPHFRWLVPPAIAVTLEVRAEGYKPWRYVEKAIPEELKLIRLQSGETRKLDIELDPDP
jgi:hypothetical protein